MCKCKNTFLYKDYKERKEKEGFLVSIDINMDDCVNCYFNLKYNTHNEDEVKEKMTVMTKKRYNTECHCGCYYPYKKHIEEQNKKGKMVAAMIPLEKCYNCYFINKYGTIDKEKIKAARIEESLKRINVRKEYRNK